ncbi:MAG: hypothetical protein ACK4N5_17175, partial [Myxococcales bacterium]
PEPAPPRPAHVEVRGELPARPLHGRDALFVSLGGYNVLAITDATAACETISGGATRAGSSTIAIQLSNRTDSGEELPLEPGLYRMLGPDDLGAPERVPGKTAVAVLQPLDEQCRSIVDEPASTISVAGHVRIFEYDAATVLRGRLDIDFFGGNVEGDFAAP